MTFSSVRFALPSPSVLKFPPSNDPQALQPLSIPRFYHEALDIKIPITISLLYAAIVKAINKYNRLRDNKPWEISKTKTFAYCVIAHNILLAIYSAWTFIGMFGALKRTIQMPVGPAGIVGFVDSLCKIHGTPGLGNGITNHSSLSQWAYDRPPLIHDRSPNPAENGRLWNEGLSFYGWVFYWSKIYEFLDTAIILVKGKQGSILQVYHHIGALICMWAGIRYMSSPIWIPTLVNSGTHALMYTYYTLTALAIPVPQNFKKSLTVIQIIQLIFSELLAGLHLFISYDIPVQGRDPPEITSPLALQARLDGLRSLQPAPQIRMETVACIDTSGQAFAIWLSVLYLTPLIGLFLQFFSQSYKGTPGIMKRTKHRAVEKVDN